MGELFNIEIIFNKVVFIFKCFVLFCYIISVFVCKIVYMSGEYICYGIFLEV